MIKTALLATALALVAVPAQAVSLVLDSGWQSDSIAIAGVASLNSPWMFTLTSDAYFRVTDAFATGDTYSVADASSMVLGSTSFSTDGAAVPTYFGVSWNDVSYSRLSLLLGAGTYALSVSGDCAAGCPSGFGVRLDSASIAGAVPEPAAWAMLIAGFGLVGAAMRRRSAAAPIVAA